MLYVENVGEMNSIRCINEYNSQVKHDVCVGVGVGGCIICSK